jgi:hypothetical protein
MATFDAATNSGVSNGTTGHVTWSHTCAASAVLIVGVCWALDAFGTPTGVTYNSSAMTAAGAGVLVASNYGVRLWYHITPASGAHTVDVSVSGPDVIAFAVSATSAGTPSDYTTATGSSTTPSVTVTNAASGDLIVDTVLSVSSISSTGANQTIPTNGGPVGPASIGFYGATSYQAGVDGGVMSWTSSASDNWAIAGIRIPNSGGGGGTAEKNFLTLLGSGA